MYLDRSDATTAGAGSLATIHPAAGILDGYQRDFPLVSRPFAQIASQHGISETELLGRCRAGIADATISRIGVVFAPNTVGASTLAAIAVPPARLDEVARAVSARAEVNHNYEREHRVNLWFVAAADTRERLEAALGELRQETRLAVLDLPLVEEFHIDLGFRLADGHVPRARRRTVAAPLALDEADRRLVDAVSAGFPIEERPYAAIAARTGLEEAEVIDRLGRWQDAGIASRIGAVLRHRRLGFRANAMVVWNVLDDRVSELGRRLAARPEVTLCYRRRRALPDWPYNLYCMIHGRERDAVRERIARLRDEEGLAGIDSATLFSRRCFVQRGAAYGTSHRTQAEARFPAEARA